MNCLTWNLEWARPKTRRGELIREGMADADGYGLIDHIAVSPELGISITKIIQPDFESAEEGEVNCHERLGGLLRYYYRDAA